MPVAKGSRSGRTTPQIRPGPHFKVNICCQLANSFTSHLYHILHLILAAKLVDNSRTLTLKLLSQNPTFYLQNEQFGNLILRQIIKFVATICHILTLKCTRFKFGWGSAPDPAGGAYSSPQIP